MHLRVQQMGFEEDCESCIQMMLYELDLMLHACVAFYKVGAMHIGQALNSEVKWSSCIIMCWEVKCSCMQEPKENSETI
jgi:hypothetical protein